MTCVTSPFRCPFPELRFQFLNGNPALLELYLLSTAPVEQTALVEQKGL